MNETKKWKLLRDAFAAKAGTVYEEDEYGGVTVPVGVTGSTALLNAAALRDWFQSVCTTCELPPCEWERHRYHDEKYDRHFTAACHCAAPEPVVPYPNPEGSVWREKDYGQWNEIIRLASIVRRNAINRDANPLKDGDEYYFANEEGGLCHGNHHLTGRHELDRLRDWRTESEARAYADLQRALLGGDR